MPEFQPFDPDRFQSEHALAGLASLAVINLKTQKTDHVQAHKQANPLKEKWFDIRRLIMNKRGLDETTAGYEASRWLLVDYMNEHPPIQNNPALCIHCNKPYSIGGDNSGIPVLNGNGGHIWMHSQCHQPWIKNLETKAKEFLHAHDIPFCDE